MIIPLYIGETNYAGNISVIANNSNACAVNSALEMNLSGQVVADSIGLNIFNGVGEQVDFLRWISSSENGKPNMVLLLCYFVYHLFA